MNYIKGMHMESIMFFIYHVKRGWVLLSVVSIIL